MTVEVAATISFESYVAIRPAEVRPVEVESNRRGHPQVVLTEEAILVIVE